MGEEWINRVRSWTFLTRRKYKESVRKYKENQIEIEYNN